MTTLWWRFLRSIFIHLLLSASITDGLLTKNREADSDGVDAATTEKKPNILFILVDDMGWHEVGYHHDGENETEGADATPNIDSLVAQGVELDRHYTHHTCSPSRSAIQSGRAPVHVNVLNACPKQYNSKDLESGFAGIPRNMTGVASVLKTAGYRTFIIGKWDAGFAVPEQLPAGRGYDSSLVYFDHANDYWTHEGGVCGGTGPNNKYYDLWYHPLGGTYPGRPATEFANDRDCNQDRQGHGKCIYEDLMFERRVTKIIEDHDVKDPLFLFWSTHIAHGPYQIPDGWTNHSLGNGQRAMNQAMARYIDASIGRVIDVMRRRNLWDNTLIVFSSDNGGHSQSNNYPLKGCKRSNWEGGIRTAAFVSGGYIPKAARGKKTEGLVAAWDWYATFAALAGADHSDLKADAAGLPGVDSINVWPLISGKTATSPREFLVIGDTVGGEEHGGDTTIGGIIFPPWKLLFGNGPGQIIDHATWTGPRYPNASSGADGPLSKYTQVCGRTPETGCLFNILEDPSEHNNLAASSPKVYNKLVALAEAEETSLFSPRRGAWVDTARAGAPLELVRSRQESDFCKTTFEKYGGYLGPWVSS